MILLSIDRLKGGRAETPFQLIFVCTVLSIAPDRYISSFLINVIGAKSAL